jgi:DNA-binding PadR family transcriptional regulator
MAKIIINGTARRTHSLLRFIVLFLFFNRPKHSLSAREIWSDLSAVDLGIGDILKVLEELEKDEIITSRLKKIKDVNDPVRMYRLTKTVTITISN